MAKYGCDDFSETQFSPICPSDIPDVGKTEPLALEIPMPVFPPAIPPDDCVCFTFESVQAETTTVAVTESVKPKCYVEIEQYTDESGHSDCCDGKYKVTPHIEVPKCLYPDDTTWKAAKTSGAAMGSLGLKYRTQNCGLEMEFTGSLPPVPCVPSPAGNKFTLKAKFRDSEGEEQEEPADFSITFPKEGTACAWEIGDATLDLTKLDIGKYSNAGTVFSPTDGAGKGELYVDGTIYEDVLTFYGGGLGDVSADVADDILRRGQYMRNDYNDDRSGLYVPAVLVNTQQLYANSGNIKQEWHATTKDYSVEGELKITQGDGNLNMLMPSGFQWAFLNDASVETIGLGVTMSKFEITPDGIIGKVSETNTLVTVSPAPVYRETYSEDDKAYHYNNNASGLIAMPASQDASENVYSAGLSVLCGGGLHIQAGTVNNKPIYINPDIKTTEGGTSTLSKLDGELSILYGQGLKMTTKQATKAYTYACTANNDIGALTLNYGRGLQMVKGCTETDADNPAYNGKLELLVDDKMLCFYGNIPTVAKLGLNDATPGANLGDLTRCNWNADVTEWDATAGTELLVRVVSALSVDTDGKIVPNSIRHTYLRFTRTGILVSMHQDDSSTPSTTSTGAYAGTRNNSSGKTVSACGERN